MISLNVPTWTDTVQCWYWGGVQHTFFIKLKVINLEYSVPSLVSPHCIRKSGLSRGVGSRQGYKSIYSSLDLHFQVAFPGGWPLIRVSSQKGLHCIHILISIYQQNIWRGSLHHVANKHTWDYSRQSCSHEELDGDRDRMVGPEQWGT